MACWKVSTEEEEGPLVAAEAETETGEGASPSADATADSRRRRRRVREGGEVGWWEAAAGESEEERGRRRRLPGQPEMRRPEYLLSVLDHPGPGG